MDAELHLSRHIHPQRPHSLEGHLTLSALSADSTLLSMDWWAAWEQVHLCTIGSSSFGLSQNFWLSDTEERVKPSGCFLPISWSEVPQQLLATLRGSRWSGLSVSLVFHLCVVRSGVLTGGRGLTLSDVRLHAAAAAGLISSG